MFVEVERNIKIKANLSKFYKHISHSLQIYVT